MKIDRTAGYNDPIYDESDVIDLLNLIVRRELAAKDQSFTKKKNFEEKKSIFDENFELKITFFNQNFEFLIF